MILYRKIPDNEKKYIQINILSDRSYWIPTTLPYDSFEKEDKYRDFICVKRRDIRQEIIDYTNKHGCKYECYVAKYQSGFGIKFHHYPFQHFRRWRSIFSNAFNEDELNTFRKAIIYGKIIYTHLVIDSWNTSLDIDILRYIKRLYCKDVDFRYFKYIVII